MIGIREALPATSALAPRAEAVPAPAALATLTALFAALNRAGVRYCHWKSNLRLNLSLAGATDLDVLVDPACAAEFSEVLNRFRVLKVLAPPGKRYPAIEDYVGFDPAAGRLFHLHVHYRLVLGEQFVKNYCLPLEAAFLDSARLRQGVMVPAPELELMVLSLRSLLKYRDRDGVKDVLGIRSPGIPDHIAEELHWLLGQASESQVRESAATLLGPAAAEAIGGFLRVFVTSPRDGRALLGLRHSVRRALRPARRAGRAGVLWRYGRESVRRRNRLRFSPPRKMTLPAGGLSIALLGADGAGKTTVAAELGAWLSRLLDTRSYYMGSKQPSWASDRLYTTFRAFRRGHREFSARFGYTNPIARSLARAWQACLYAHYLSVGLDRYRRHQAGRRAAQGGATILTDRFPLAAPLDGPVIRKVAASDDSRAARSFARWEEALYRRFQPPDLFIVLAVDPDTSLQRKPDHNRETVEAKARLLRQLVDEPGGLRAASRVAEIDAGQPLPGVLAEARSAIWDSLTATQPAILPIHDR